MLCGGCKTLHEHHEADYIYIYIYIYIYCSLGSLSSPRVILKMISYLVLSGLSETKSIIFISLVYSLFPIQWASGAKMTSHQRQCDVITSHRRFYDVILRRVPAGKGFYWLGLIYNQVFNNNNDNIRQEVMIGPEQLTFLKNYVCLQLLAQTRRFPIY